MNTSGNTIQPGIRRDSDVQATQTRSKRGHTLLPPRFILHRMQSKHSLKELKNAPKVANLMQKYDFYVNDHRWCETDWDTNQLGFFYGIDPHL
jgi:hypothetical protein